MDDIRFRYYSPVISGTPKVDSSNINSGSTTAKDTGFKEILEEQISKSNVNFSKHAVQRLEDRSLNLDDESLRKLDEGVKMASEKSLRDALILVDKTAFIVNIPSNTVITAKGNDETDIFTNINGAVIM